MGKKRTISFTKRLTLGGLLTAAAVLLTGPLSIPLTLFGGYMKNISFGAAAVMYAGLLMGPTDGFLIGCLGDILCFFLFPKGGGYFPGFSVTYGLIGMLPPLFLRKTGNPKMWQLFLAVAATHFLCSFCLNSFFLVTFFKQASQIIFLRAGVQCVMVVVYTAALFPLLQLGRRLVPIS